MTHQMRQVAHLRADLHNTSAKGFTHHFTADEFIAGGPTLEDKIHELMNQGYTKVQACAIATSKRSKQDNLLIFKTAAAGAAAKEQPRQSTRRRKA